MATIQIYNRPDYAKNYEYFVAKLVDGKFYFWGAFNEKERAEKTAAAVDGVVFHNVKNC